jgi:hypothetical protein
MSAPYIFTVEGETFILGLFWQPLSGTTQSERSKEIVALAQELSFDMAVTRNASMYSVGFAKSSQALKIGVFSAAAIVSKSLDVELKARDFIFVSPLPDGQYVYVAQRDGVILADGDRVFVSEDAARACLLEHMSLGDWPLVIAPAIWGIGGSIERDFASLLPRAKNGKIKVHKWWKLMPVDRRRAVFVFNARTIAAVSIIAAVLIGGGIFYKKWKADRDARLAAEAAAAAARMVATGSAEVRPEDPWKSQPLARDMVRACLSTLVRQMVFPGNWEISDINCSGGNLVISWKPRSGGWIKHLKEIEPAVVVAMDGSSATLSVPLPPLETGYDEEAPQRNDRVVAMYSAAQAYGVTLKLSDAAPPPAPVLPGQKQEQKKIYWNEMKWVADGVLFPDVVLAALDGSGFRINAMRGKFVNGSFVWSMEGIQYVQP